MKRFIQDNTEGYSDTDLAELNLMFAAAMLGYVPTGDEWAEEKSYYDYLAERVLAIWDAESSK
jgi:hypothetical protein